MQAFDSQGDIRAPQNRSYQASEGCHTSETLRSITYSMDLLIPGLYIWAGKFGLRIGGARVDDEPYRYPVVIHSPVGIALVLPGYRIFSTYSGSYDPR
jgi:hypothetical protein